MSRLWEKGDSINDTVLRFSVGNDHLLDERLVKHDVRGSIAHARMLCSIGALSDEDCETLCAGLQEIGESHARGEWHIAMEEEDCHTAIENRLVEATGEAGERVHLGRSRNDQVMTALRLYLLEVEERLEEAVGGLVAALSGVRERQGNLALPGYTHMQRAMPSSVALWVGGFEAEFEDDIEGLRASRRRMDKNPLGSAAGYGVPVFELDREHTARALGFSVVQEPVTAVQLSRGKAEAGWLFEISLLIQDVGRLAAELCLFASAEFGFVQLPAAFTTGSSIMPQKRNPDVFELLRGRAARAHTDLVEVLSLTAKMPSGYHRDLQLIKPPLFGGIDSTLECLEVAALAVENITFLEEPLQRAMDESLRATKRAYTRVQSEGIPFRQAYREVAAAQAPPKKK